MITEYPMYESCGLLYAAGFLPTTVRRAAVASYEIEINIIIHANEGKLRLIINPDFIEIHAVDCGPAYLTKKSL